MNKNLFLFFSFIILGSFCATSQIRDFTQNGRGFGNLNRGNINNLDSLPDNEIQVKLSGKTNYTDYKIINYKGDTTLIDTILTLQKEYLFNFRRKDNFELLAFQNQGQTYNTLGYNFASIDTELNFGFTAKRFNFYTLQDLMYYDVPTPTTEIMYRSGNEQGQVLDALFTLNFSRRFNIALSYKGLRSLGYYRNSLASHGNFRASFRYETPKGQYAIKGNTIIQDLSNQENGGITDAMLENFLENDSNFTDRGRIDINLPNAESLLDGKSYYIEQSLRLFSTETNKENKLKILNTSKIKNDSIAQPKQLSKDFTNLKIGNAILLDNQFYKFTQSSLNTAVFGNANISNNLENKTAYNMFQNNLFVDFNSKYILGNFRAKVTYRTFEYGYTNLINISAFQNGEIADDRIGGQAISFGADWFAKIKKIQFKASAYITPGSGYLSGSNLVAEALYKKDSTFSIKGRFLINSKSANLNTLLFQSNYINYNWQNNFNNIETRNIGGNFSSKWFNASLDISNIDEYVFFNENGTPEQTSKNLNYIKIKINKEFIFGKFALNNTLMYQNVSSGSTFFRVPELVSRNTLYYSDDWFKGKPILVNIGLTFKYFSNYKANAFNPLVNEFMIQNTTEIGNYPTIDFFFNGRVKRTRLYFKLDNITSFFGEKRYFSAPNYPYRDFAIRFGLVWNWFI